MAHRCAGCKRFVKPDADICPSCGADLKGAENGKPAKTEKTKTAEFNAGNQGESGGGGNPPSGGDDKRDSWWEPFGRQ